MPRRLSIQEHLSIDELERNYRATYDLKSGSIGVIKPEFSATNGTGL
ncbi:MULTISPECIES: hypothetical protein [unclassified Okeania]|nr:MULTISPECIES: hypothetical protein [unclassified Okeania]NES77367.1 hypothetical protein [Okeania sp. SIO1H4]NET20979.1 hypothetical protein [Okeania sp. SIO1H5]NET94243.1 hypothetical protein [Okeania sp. SIO1H2]